jgi:hypothetical protein
MNLKSINFGGIYILRNVHMGLLTFYHIISLSLSLSLIFLMNLKLIKFGGICIL